MIVSAPCRLHFGLFHVPVEGLTHGPDGAPLRRYGGLGMMVEEPRIRVAASYDRKWFTRGTLGKRATEFVRIASEKITIASSGIAFNVHANGPREHVGLGVGTALGMAIATAANRLEGGYVPEDSLPHLIGRGRRSGIGIHGFRHGGFIVDDGKLDDELPAIRERIPVPDAWRVVLATPRCPAPWHGDRERAAFGRNRSPDEALDTTRRLRDLADQCIVPALKRAEFDSFSDAITRFNRIAGEPFAADQGGPYANPATAELIEQCLSWGVRGVGQSSWGPTVFAFAKDERDAELLRERLEKTRSDLDFLVRTPADNVGARSEDATPAPDA